MSSAPPRPPEFFLERSLGRLTADEEWIDYGCSRGWLCLTKDKRIRYRAAEIGALRTGHVFCLADGNLRRSESSRRLIEALPAMVRGAARHEVGFWHVYGEGRVQRMWP